MISTLEDPITKSELLQISQQDRPSLIRQFKPLHLIMPNLLIALMDITMPNTATIMDISINTLMSNLDLTPSESQLETSENQLELTIDNPQQK